MRFVTIGFAHGHIDGAVAGFRQLPGLELVGIADSNPERLADRQRKLEVTAYADYREMLDALKPEFAAVCPANADKAAVIADAARGGMFATSRCSPVSPGGREAAVALGHQGVGSGSCATPVLRAEAAHHRGGSARWSASPPAYCCPRAPEMLDCRNGGVRGSGSHDIDLAVTPVAMVR